MIGFYFDSYKKYYLKNFRDTVLSLEKVLTVESII